MARYATLILIVIGAGCTNQHPQPSLPPWHGPDAALMDTSSNRLVHVRDLRGSKGTVIFFGGNVCPVSVAYERYLAELDATWKANGVAIVEVNSNYNESPREIRDHAMETMLPFPIYKDPDTRFADALGVSRMSETVLLDARGRVVYHGRIDDRYSIAGHRARATQRELLHALDALMAGRAVSTTRTEASGCFISKRRTPQPSSVTYAAHIAPIVESHCVQCHRPGQAGPMSLLTYEDVAAWSETIREVVEQEEMPPWMRSGADPRYGDFKNPGGLSADDKTMFARWVEAGTPRGEASRSQGARAAPGEWQIGEPDLVLWMPRSFSVPAKAPRGGVPYQYFVVMENNDDDRWVEAVEIRPGTRSVVHHVIAFMTHPDLPATLGPGERWASYTPGRPPTILPAGLAQRFPKGAKLSFQVHYTPDGVPRSDRSSIGIRFSRVKPKYEVRNIPLGTAKIDIPPYAPNVEISATYTLQGNGKIYAMTPHMHTRGKDFRYDALLPDGTTKTLLLVPRYDFNWQHTYVAREMIALPKGTVVRATAHFDNSGANLNNPDPSARVGYGSQTWDEMMFGFLDLVYDDEIGSPNLLAMRQADKEYFRGIGLAGGMGRTRWMRWMGALRHWSFN